MFDGITGLGRLTERGSYGLARGRMNREANRRSSDWDKWNDKTDRPTASAFSGWSLSTRSGLMDDENDVRHWEGAADRNKAYKLASGKKQSAGSTDHTLLVPDLETVTKRQDWYKDTYGTI